MANTRLSLFLDVKVRRVTCEDTIYLMWFNKFGAHGQWDFEGNRTELKRVFGTEGYKANEISIRKGDFGPGSIYPRSDGQNKIIKKESQDKILLTAKDLDIDDVDVIKSILDAVQVVRLLNFNEWEIDGPELMNVIISESTFEIRDTNVDRFEIGFEVTLQDNKIPTR